MDEMLSPKQLAARLGISPVAVYRWIKYRKIPFIQIGKQYRIPSSVLDELTDDRWVKIRDAAKLLDISTPTIYRLIKTGQLDAKQFPTGLRINLEELYGKAYGAGRGEAVEEEGGEEEPEGDSPGS